MKLAIFAASLTSIFVACKTSQPTASPNAKIMSNSKLASFGSEAEFQEYMANLGKTMIGKQKNGQAYSKGGTPSATSAEANESITNNQEAGVDEGGIVKNIGDYLVVLHRGRLSAVSIADNQLKETDSMFVARTAELQKNVWYDEILVNGDMIYVVGFRYHTNPVPPQNAADPCQRRYIGATEVNSYALKDGKLQRLQTRFIESSDYYSGENYASRMVDGRLVFYMPHPAFDFCGTDKAEIRIPQELNYDARTGFTAIKPLLAGTDVYKNIDTIEQSAMFHSVVSCGLPGDGGLDCKAKAVLGDYTRTRYVTKDFVYLATAKKIYSLALKDLNVRAHASNGLPINQFSFKEVNGELQMIVEDYNSPDTTGQPQALSACSIRLLKLPLSQFDAGGNQDVSQRSTDLYRGQYCSINANRFVGRHAIVVRYSDSGDQQELMAVNTENASKRILTFAGHVGRIEVLSDEEAFITVRRNDGNLELGDLRLDTPDLKLTSIRVGKAAEGESRSHGFFQKPQDDGSHLIGLPILTLRADNTAWWGQGLSNVAYIRVGGDDAMKLIGSVESGKDPAVCQSSCIDWYGNTRPIFLRDRLFALMGHEIAEIKLNGEAITPASRVQMFGGVRQ